MTDGTTLEGLLQKTNFTELGEGPIETTVRIEVARKYTIHVQEVGVKDYSQWFPGAENQVADADISRLLVEVFM